MHCGLCGNMQAEVRPINIGAQDIKHIIDGLNKDVIKGDYYSCRKCADELALYCQDSFLICWTGFPCDECSQMSAFNGPIDDMPEGIVCDECTPSLPADADSYKRFTWSDEISDRGLWLCEHCYDARHYGHRQKQLQPILDQLANL